MSASISLVPTVTPENFVIVVLWGFFLLVFRRYKVNTITNSKRYPPVLQLRLISVLNICLPLIYDFKYDLHRFNLRPNPKWQTTLNQLTNLIYLSDCDVIRVFISYSFLLFVSKGMDDCEVLFVFKTIKTGKCRNKFN